MSWLQGREGGGRKGWGWRAVKWRQEGEDGRMESMGEVFDEFKHMWEPRINKLYVLSLSLCQFHTCLTLKSVSQIWPIKLKNLNSLINSLVIYIINKHKVFTNKDLYSASIKLQHFHTTLPLPRGIKWICFGRLVFMNYKQDVVIQSLGPCMSERVFSLQQGLMRAEISEPQRQTGHIHHPASAAKGRNKGVKRKWTQHPCWN